MRSRSLFVHRARLARLSRSTGLLGPLSIAVALAVAGTRLDAAPEPVAATPVAAPAAAAAAEALTRNVSLRPLGVADFPQRVVRGTAVARAGLAQPKAPKAAAKKKAVAPRRAPVRASRSTRTRAVAPPVRTGWVRPSGGAVTSYYGMRWGRMHRGLDFGAPYGAPIYAASAGVVTFAGPQGGYGRLVTIRHSDGYVTAYGHMSRTIVRSGQRVSAGQVIAYVGSEGRSTGPHLHFEVRTGGGGFVNPLPFLRSRGVRV